MQRTIRALGYLIAVLGAGLASSCSGKDEGNKKSVFETIPFEAPSIVVYETEADRHLFENIKRLYVDGVKQALSSGANPNAIHPEYELQCPLSMLMVGGFPSTRRSNWPRKREIAGLLLSQGANIRPQDDLLFFPVSDGDLQMIQLLLDHGADPFRPMEGRTPIEWAVYYNQMAVVKFFEGEGARVPDILEAAQIRLYYAIHSGKLADVVDALKNGGEIDGLRTDNRTPLAELLSEPVYGEDKFLVLKYLLSQGADPNKAGRSRFDDIEGIPIHLAVVWATDPGNDAEDRMRKYSLDTIRTLIRNGAVVSQMDAMGRTPLHIAAEFDHVSAAEILLDAGCRVMPKDNDGKTPMDYAESSEMIALLKKHGAVETP